MEGAMRILCTSVGAVVLLLGLAAPAPAQLLLERSTLLNGGWVGQPWTLEVRPSFRFAQADGARGLQERATFEAGLGLPAWLMAGARYTPRSPVVEARPDEWEAFGRWAALAVARHQPLDVTLQAGYNGAARSVDAELMAGRWVGPLRLHGAGRFFSDAYGAGDARAAVAAGAVLMPRPRNLPLSVAADLATPVDREAGERIAWSVAVNLGISFSTHTMSAFVTNSASGTLQGATLGDGRQRVGLAFTAPIPIGQLLGLVVPRPQAMQAVTEDAQRTPTFFPATIERYVFIENRIVIDRGMTVEWTNRDGVVHTVDADDGSWRSGAMEAGVAWRARFDEPGIYPFHCGPHPFMKGVVVVR
jgi:plastocyanin